MKKFKRPDSRNMGFSVLYFIPFCPVLHASPCISYLHSVSRQDLGAIPKHTVEFTEDGEPVRVADEDGKKPAPPQ